MSPGQPTNNPFGMSSQITALTTIRDCQAAMCRFCEQLDA
jgi:hypothetical protein